MVTVTDLAKKHPGKPAYKGLYSFVKHVYQDDGKIVTESFVLDKEVLEIIRTKILALLIDDDKPGKKKLRK
jgi:hypothetical protein